MQQQMINLLAITGAVGLAFNIATYIKTKIRRRREEKLRRLRRIERFRNYRPASMQIANEFAAELKDKQAPVRKATGCFSDAAAQEVVK